jgi:hypothetical protein
MNEHFGLKVIAIVVVMFSLMVISCVDQETMAERFKEIFPKHWLFCEVCEINGHIDVSYPYIYGCVDRLLIAGCEEADLGKLYCMMEDEQLAEIVCVMPTREMCE